MSERDPFLAVPAEELPLRQSILDALEEQDPSRRFCVSADTFQSILRALHLRFGDPLVDRVMLQCSISDRGDVNFAAFSRDVAQRRISSWGPDPSKTVLPAPSVAEERGNRSQIADSYEFRSAVEATTGRSLPSSALPPEIAALPYAERIRALSRDISALFTQFDTAVITLDTFRARLRGLGIIETPEVTRILHQEPVRYSSLYRALQAGADQAGSATALSSVDLFRPVPSAFPRGASSAHAPSSSFTSKIGTAGEAPPPFGRMGSPKYHGVGPIATTGRPGSAAAAALPAPGAKPFNPITGSGVAGVGETAPMRLDRGAAVGPYNTAAAGNVDTGAATATHAAPEDRRALYDETGAGNLIFHKGANAPGAEYGEQSQPGFRFNQERSKMGRGPRGDKQFLEEEGAGRLVGPGGTDGVPAGERFESHAQAAERTGLWGKADEAHRPATAAGYRTADGGMLREQVYSAVRLLDAGRVSPAQFRERLAAAGVSPVPPAVERLLGARGGRGTAAGFSAFVRAFEDFLAERTTALPPAEAAARERERQLAAEPPAPPQSGCGVRPYVDREAMLLRNREAAAHPVRPAPGYTASADADRFTAGHTSAGAYFSAHIKPQQRTHGDIVTWSTAPTDDEAEQRKPTRPPPDRRLFDTYSWAPDLLSVEQRRDMGRLHELSAGAGPMHPAIRDLTARRNVNPERHRDSGDIVGWAGTAFGPEHARAELDSSLAGGRGKGRVAGSPLAQADRSGLREPYGIRDY